MTPSKRVPMDLETVPVDSLQGWPGNPRIGDAALLAESLTQHGQYKPIVVQRSTRRVIAGNQTLAAIRAQGWPDVRVLWIDVDDDRAARIAYIDNSAADRAKYDTALLVAGLENLPDLTGTGFDYDELDKMRDQLDRSAARAAEQATAADAGIEAAARPSRTVFLEYTPEQYDQLMAALAVIRADRGIGDDARIILQLVKTEADDLDEGAASWGQPDA